jgi:carbon storage regulator
MASGFREKGSTPVCVPTIKGVGVESLFKEEISMLVLSRKVGERILVGDHVIVTVVRIGPNSVRLGIEAPKDQNIVREELIVDVPLDEVSVLGSVHPIQVDVEELNDFGRKS